MARQPAVLVVGGGVIGVCSAYYLRRAGFEVDLVEQFDIGSGCSHGNAGLVVPSHSLPLAAPGVVAKGLRWMWNPESPFYLKPRLDPSFLAWLARFAWASRRSAAMRAVPPMRDLLQTSRRLFDELYDSGVASFFYVRRGVLNLYRSAQAMSEGMSEVALLNRFGIRARPVAGDEVRAIAPIVDRSVVGGILHEEDAHLQPREFVTALAGAAEALGARLHPRVAVERFELNGGRVTKIITAKGDFAPNDIVLAAGSWTPEIARSLPLNVPIQPAKGYSITCRLPDSFPPVPLTLTERKVIATPMGSTLRFAGTLELAGFDWSISQRRVAAIRKAIPLYLRHVEPLEELEVWGGLRPCAPDGLPIIGQPSRIENVVIAAGHAMLGMSLGPVTGLLVSEILSGARPSVDLAPFRPDRF